jgi:flavin reductase (DIM6/NTAB) family NADH-FMN oxidoreductase RutF
MNFDIFAENFLNKMHGFNELDVKNFHENIFKLFDDDWTLITAGTAESFNTMTASWGTMGTLWNLPVAICFIRPHRFTHNFAVKASHFTLSFFDEEHRDILNFCGKYSGKDRDKIAETGLKPVITPSGAITYEQARLVFECRKLYSDKFREDNFLIKDVIAKSYPRKDFHTFFIGEILKCYVK